MTKTSNKFAKFADKALSNEQAENVTGGKVAASFAGVDDKCLCTYSNGSQESGSTCKSLKEGDEVPGHPGLTVSKKEGAC